MSSNHSVPRKRPSKSLRNQPKPEGPVDDSAWIHRDKLAAIEIQEMEEAGMHVRQPHRSDSTGHNGRTTRSSSRSMSRSGVRRAQSKDMLGESSGGDEYRSNGYDEHGRKRVSTIHAADEEEYYDQEFDPYIHAELRTPEEVAAEHHAYRQHAVRPSTSRIPISKISSVPVPNDMVERDSPLPRSRSGSNAFPSTWDDMKRIRSGSAGSGILLDDSDNNNNSYTLMRPSSSLDKENTLSQSPPKSKTAPRKSGGTASRSASAQRPTSSSGKRPSTSHNRPEGEAPWIATMYKPDPRLPPDQQMLPTHAKRIAQEQLEREGTPTYSHGRDSKSPDGEEFDQHTTSKPTVIVQQPPVNYNKENIPPPTIINKNNVVEEWPLTPSGDNRSGADSPRPGTSNGGYRITPTLTSSTPPPPPPQPQQQQQQQQQRRSQVNEVSGPAELPATEKPPTRMPDYDEKDEIRQKKGCCCVMM